MCRKPTWRQAVTTPHRWHASQSTPTYRHAIRLTCCASTAYADITVATKTVISTYKTCSVSRRIMHPDCVIFPFLRSLLTSTLASHRANFGSFVRCNPGYIPRLISSLQRKRYLQEETFPKAEACHSLR